MKNVYTIILVFTSILKCLFVSLAPLPFFLKKNMAVVKDVELKTCTGIWIFSMFGR
jgi:hypothetical protein